MPAAAGPINKSLENLEDLIANSAQFRTWTGTATPTLAKDRIHMIAKDATPTRPFAFLDYGSDIRFVREGVGGSNTYSFRGSLWILFEAAVSSSDPIDHQEDFMTFTNNVEVILNEMTDLSGTSGYIDIPEFVMIDPPLKSSLAEEGSGDPNYKWLWSARWGP